MSKLQFFININKFKETLKSLYTNLYKNMKLILRMISGINLKISKNKRSVLST